MNDRDVIESTLAFPLYAIEQNGTAGTPATVHSIVREFEGRRERCLVLFQSEGALQRYLGSLVSSGPSHILTLRDATQLGELLHGREHGEFPTAVIDPASPRQAAGPDISATPLPVG